LIGAEGSEKFVDMSAVYDKEIIDYLKTAHNVGSGVYAAMRGPQYETPSEVKFAKIIGADAVGMSTVSESIMARFYGMKIVGVSMISNMASGITGQPLSHQEVLEAGRTSGEAVKNVLLKIVENF
jgi:purine-nucleoside phosphorylase